MKSLMLLWHEVLDELGTWCCTSTTRDYEYVARRVKHEGLSFLTITLPELAEGLQKGLSQGQVDFDTWSSAWRKTKCGLPRFLSGFLSRVFDAGSGMLLEEPDVDSIFAVRQLSLMFSKMLLPCSTERVAAAMSKYLQCEQDVRMNDATLSHDLAEEFKSTSLKIFGDVLSQIDLAVFSGTLVPKHGPGVTVDRLSGNTKYDNKTWTSRLEKEFPYGDYSIPNWRYSYRLADVNILEPGAEMPVKVIPVPKTLKTPRIIAVEPTHMQYVQQAIAEMLVEALEGPSGPQGLIGFQFQEPNQLLARTGSREGNLATLDLSEASDRVSNQHVRLLLHYFPHLMGGVDACRSRKADVPGKGVIRLAKFASMGSALCFPVEAMVFLTIVLMGISHERNIPVTRRLIKSLRGQVRIYGDDIIVPIDCAVRVTAYLEAFGLKVNSSKSYWNGKFRESCGKEYYDGSDVTIARCRRILPTRRDDVSEVISLVSLRNQLYERGLWRTVKWVDSRVVSILGHFPYVAPTSPVLGRHSFLGYQTDRTGIDLHNPQVKGWLQYSTPPRSPVSGEGALLKWFLKRGDEPFADRDHLERQGRPVSVNIRRRWAQPF
jgi:hypothetical protein